MARQQVARKVKDKWKAKEWYKIHAPKMFNEAEIGDTPSVDPEFVIGRTVEVTVQDLTGDFSKMHIKLKFKVNVTEGMDAKTVFVGHDLTSDYVRRLTRRRKTKTDHVVDFYQGRIQVQDQDHVHRGQAYPVLSGRGNEGHHHRDPDQHG